MQEATEPGRVRSRQVFAVREFRMMWSAELLSFMGDQFARVALSLLVFTRTDSAALTGLTYALTFVPTVVGALTLSGFADRNPRRDVIVVTDAARAIVVAFMLIPQVPLGVLCFLVAIMSLLGGPYKAAQLALLRDVLGGDFYRTGIAIRQVTVQAAQLMGFALGGVISALLSPRVCLAFDSATFAASVLLVGSGVRRRPASEPAVRGLSLATGLRTLWSDPQRRAIFLTTILGIFYIAPEGVAAPYVAELGREPVFVGLILASPGLGAVVGLPIFSRLVADDRRGLVFPVACLATGIPLIFVLAHAGIYAAMLFFAVSNALWAIQVVMSVSFLAELLSDGQRARGMGVASSMNLTAQGVGTGLGGVVAQALTPTWAIALAGLCSVLFGFWPVTLWLRKRV